MQDSWGELSEIEARATAQDRLDLHYEHRDALDVERGQWTLSDYLRGFAEVQVKVGDHSVRGQILAVGPDWVHLPTALVSLTSVEILLPKGVGQAERTVLQFRQAVRQLAGRVAREVVLANGRSHMMAVEWVASDFLHARIDGAAAVIPLSEVAVVFGRLDG